MKARHLASARDLLRTYLSQFDLWIEFDLEEMRHWILPTEGVIDSFVVEDPKDSTKVTDFCSFYHLPSSIIGHDVHKTLNAAYSFYNVATSMSLEKLMNDALILARDRGFDVFNCLDVQDNKEFLKPLKFGIGDGHLQYYLYNWRAQIMEAQRVGIVLL